MKILEQIRADEDALAARRRLDKTTDAWVLQAKVDTYKKALAESLESERACGEEAINLASELHHLKEGVRGFALTLRKWAVAAGGHTPSAIVASKLLELIGDEKSTTCGADDCVVCDSDGNEIKEPA